MSIPSRFLTTTCNIYRPFGGTLSASAVPCWLVADLSGVGSLFWSHHLDVDDTIDVRDGSTRAAGTNAITYADGDEVRIPDAAGTSYVVVWVEMHNRGTPQQFKRAYLLRDTAVWPGP